MGCFFLSNSLRVASREEFVGRRRQLQNCLRTLKRDYDKVGVLLHGMGGWGKSSIASRLWDRLPDYEKILWWQDIDEFKLIKKLKKKLDNSRTRELIPDLENYKLELESRLTDLFSQLAEMVFLPFLFILDDFEWNLEPREGQYILKPKVAPILKALVEAIQDTGTENKIIITCRYEFDSELLEFFFSQGLEPLRKAELTKKLNRLEHFSSDNLSVQYNPQADKAFESELRQLEDELSEENFYSQLEDHLRQGNWRKADEETAWLFYLVMVQQGYKDWSELCRNFPSKTLNQIDQLWVDYSQGHFGFSIQKRIWESLGGKPNAYYGTWEKFGKQVEWYDEENDWKEYNLLPFSIESLDGNLPALWIIRESLGFGWLVGFASGTLVVYISLFSRIKT